MNFSEVSSLWAPAWLMEIGGLGFGGGTLTELGALGQEQVKEHRWSNLKHLGSMLRA